MIAVPPPENKNLSMYEAALAFFTKIFENAVAPDQEDHKREVYTHPTTATDTKNIERVLEAVRDTILQSNLRAYAVV